MNQTWKIVLPIIIITVVIVGSGVYYWKNSKTSLPMQVARETNNNRTIVNDPINEVPAKITESTDKTTDWKAYSGMGVTIKYPNDVSYSVEIPQTDGFIIGQEYPGNRIHVSKTTDSSLSDSEITKIINGNSYKVFYRKGMGSGYGYTIKRDGQFYIFESVWGPENEVFELMMTTVKFE